ncbi:MAG TPA: hydrolase [Planctomycetes bacterium]|nr:hydrolase [Planctomycetota bacterium]
MPSFTSNHGPLQRDRTVLVLVDVQEKLFPLMQGRLDLQRRLTSLLCGFRLLSLPVVITEQNPQGLGPTIAPLQPAVGEARVVAKTSFSCCGEPAFLDALRETERDQVVLAGIETHICVAGTAIDLLAQGYEVSVVADAVSTRLPHTHAIGLQRMTGAGVVPWTVEGVLFRLAGDSKCPEFKDLLRLVKEGV